MAIINVPVIECDNVYSMAPFPNNAESLFHINQENVGLLGEYEAKKEQLIPLKKLETWFDQFQRNLTGDPDFWKK